MSTCSASSTLQPVGEVVVPVINRGQIKIFRIIEITKSKTKTKTNNQIKANIVFISFVPSLGFENHD